MLIKSNLCKNAYFCKFFSRKNSILFFGSDNISKIVLETLLKNYEKIEKIEIVTHHTQKIEKNPFLLAISKENLKYYTPISSKDKNIISQQWRDFFSNEISLKNFDIGIVCSFGYLLPNFIIDIFKRGSFVVHPSILPKYRGAAPIQHVLLNGEKNAGVSIVEISKNRFDAGKILMQKKIEIDFNDRYKELSEKLAILGGECILEAVENLEELIKNGKIQNENEATPAKKLSIENTLINWNLDDSETIYRKYKAFYGSGLTTIRTKLNNEILFIQEMKIATQREQEALNQFINIEPGFICFLKQFKKQVFVKCNKGWISFQMYNFANTTKMPAAKFIEKYLKNRNFEKDPLYFK